MVDYCSMNISLVSTYSCGQLAVGHKYVDIADAYVFSVIWSQQETTRIIYLLPPLNTHLLTEWVLGCSKECMDTGDSFPRQGSVHLHEHKMVYFLIPRNIRSFSSPSLSLMCKWKRKTKWNHEKTKQNTKAFWAVFREINHLS